MQWYLYLFVSFIFFVDSSVSAQEGIPVYFDYLTDNDYLVHPAMAGLGNGGKVRLTGRQQWFNVDEAPNLQTLNIQYRVPYSPSGVGIIVFKDANGYHSQSGLKFTYAHHLDFTQDARIFKQLSFGMSVTTLQSSLDETDFRSIFPDPLITGSLLSSFYFNVDMGVSYAYKEWYAHATVLNALQTERKLYRLGRGSVGNVPVVDNLRRYLISLGYRIDKGDWWIEPSVMFQLSDFSQEKTLDVNGKIYKNFDFATLWTGFSFRGSFDAASFQADNQVLSQRLQLFTPIVGANFKQFVVSYNYTYQMGDFKMGNGGFHQITLGMDFGLLRDDRFNPKWRTAPLSLTDNSN